MSQIKRSAIVGGLFAILLANGALAATKSEVTEWQVDKPHSRVSFWVKHLGITKVRGHFNDFDATIKADGETGKVTAVEATAKTKSIDTGVEKRDDHLRSDDFFNAEKFADLKLKTKSIKWDGKKFTAECDLTMRDVTKTVTFKGEQSGVQKVNFGSWQKRTGYTATATVNRQQFGLKFNAVAEGTAVVDDNVTIELELELFRPVSDAA